MAAPVPRRVSRPRNRPGDLEKYMDDHDLFLSRDTHEKAAQVWERRIRALQSNDINYLDSVGIHISRDMSRNHSDRWMVSGVPTTSLLRNEVEYHDMECEALLLPGKMWKSKWLPTWMCFWARPIERDV